MKNNLSPSKRPITFKIIFYIFMMLISIFLIVFIISTSGSNDPRFIGAVVGTWALFMLFCLYKIYRARKKSSIFQKGTISVVELDDMDGIAFEELACDILLANGFDTAENTSASHDFGIDVIAAKDDITYAIQCKRYNSPVSIEAIQQAYAGRAYYECHVAVVLTNQTYTENAIKFADKLGVVLWDRETLRSLL